MAGDWIQLQRATPDKPEVWAIAETLGLDPDAVLGKLLRVWFWFDEQTENGNAKSVTDVMLENRIDSLVRVGGFAKAMRSVGWLNGTSIPNFDRHNGKSAKYRALTSERVKRHRNAAIVTEPLPEKRREEVNLKSNPLSGSPPDAPRLEARKGNGAYIAQAEQVLDYLNRTTGRDFRFRNPNGKLTPNADVIVARLGEGYSAEQLREVVLLKAERWKGDEKMAEFLRPATLFGKQKFAQYMGELEARRG